MLEKSPLLVLSAPLDWRKGVCFTVTTQILAALDGSFEFNCLVSSQADNFISLTLRFNSYVPPPPTVCPHVTIYMYLLFLPLAPFQLHVMQ